MSWEVDINALTQVSILASLDNYEYGVETSVQYLYGLFLRDELAIVYERYVPLHRY